MKDFINCARAIHLTEHGDYNYISDKLTRRVNNHNMLTCRTDNDSCKIRKAMGTGTTWYPASLFSWVLNANPLRHIREANICYI